MLLSFRGIPHGGDREEEGLFIHRACWRQWHEWHDEKWDLLVWFPTWMQEFVIFYQRANEGRKERKRDWQQKRIRLVPHLPSRRDDALLSLQRATRGAKNTSKPLNISRSGFLLKSEEIRNITRHRVQFSFPPEMVNGVLRDSRYELGVALMYTHTWIHCCSKGFSARCGDTFRIVIARFHFSWATSAPLLLLLANQEKEKGGMESFQQNHLYFKCLVHM